MTIINKSNQKMYSRSHENNFKVIIDLSFGFKFEEYFGS